MGPHSNPASAPYFLCDLGQFIYLILRMLVISSENRDDIILTLRGGCED